MSDLLYSEAEDDLRAAVRSLLADRAGPAAVLARAEAAWEEDRRAAGGGADGGAGGAGPYDPALWAVLAREMGLAGLLVPEKLGGAGASHREAAVVLEELGRSVAPAPYLTGAVIAVEALLGCGAERDEVAALLAGTAAGRRTAVLAVPWPTGPWRGGAAGERAAVTATVRARPGGSAAAGRLTGAVSSVADAPAADVFLVPADDGLHAVEAAAGAVEPVTPLDLTRPLGRLVLDAAPAVRLAGAEVAAAAVERALLAGAGLLAAEQLGLAEWCLTTTVAYLKERRQFARPVGGFQAVKHRLARLWLQQVSARATARTGPDALARGAGDAAVTAAVAQAYCGDAAVRAAEEALQLHGGIGMTWEYPVHLYLKRAMSDRIALGTPGHHRTALAALADLPA
ncbi:acyl-CoA dehydrogenase family protein [Streptomyces synnematoformans]|uniref:Acyl-CoA dehydrogenase family protein n=1 Tax=Streptomyces synnematoformans TaxID=415721 RepID=A0ABN2YJK0_9ACTN